MFHISVLLFDTNVVFLFGERHHGGVLFMVTVVWLASSFPWIRMWSLSCTIGIVVPLFGPYIDMVFSYGKGGCKRFSLELVPLFDPETNIVSYL